AREVGDEVVTQDPQLTAHRDPARLPHPLEVLEVAGDVEPAGDPRAPDVARRGAEHQPAERDSRTAPKAIPAALAPALREDVVEPLRVLPGEPHVGLSDLAPLPQVPPRRDDVALPADRVRVEADPAAGGGEPVAEVEVGVRRQHVLR